MLADEGFELNAAKTAVDQIERRGTAESVLGHPGNVGAARAGLAGLVINVATMGINPKTRRKHRRKHYHRSVPLKFRKKTKAEMERAEPEGVPTVDVVLAARSRDADMIRAAIRGAIYSRETHALRRLPDVIRAYPEFSQYIVSGLTQTADVIVQARRHDVARSLAQLLLEDGTPQMATRQLCALFATIEYQQRAQLLLYAERRAEVKDRAGFHSILDALRLSGGIPKALYVHFDEADGWAQRMFLAAAAPMWRKKLVKRMKNADVFAAALSNLRMST